LPASAERRAVEREVSELERLCGALERDLVSGHWAGVANSLRDSRRATHAFRNAMEAAAEARDDAFDRAVETRVQRVLAVRDDQLARLIAYHDGVAERLRLISGWKRFARSVRAKDAPRKRTVGLDRRG